MPTSKWLLALLWLPLAHAAPPQSLPLAGGTGEFRPSEEPERPGIPDWSTLTPTRQRELRAHYAAWRALPESERARVRRAAAAFAALPAERRSALRVRFQNQDRLYRDGWRLGPRLGAIWPKLQPLLGYLPDTQREATLTLLAGLSDEQLQQLVLISQRTPPQERDSVRDGLLATTPANRDAWLRARVSR